MRPRGGTRLLPRRSIDLWFRPRGFGTDLSQRIGDDHGVSTRHEERLDLCEFRLDPRPTATAAKITQTVRLTLKTPIGISPPTFPRSRRAVEI